MVYMDLVLNEEVSVDLPLGRLILSRVNDNLIKIEFTGLVNVRPKLVGGVSKDVKVSLRPTPPSGNMIKVNYLFISFKEPITVLPRESVDFFIDLPVDLGIHINDYLTYSVPTIRVKYALYGPSDLGDLCRYVNLTQIKDLQRRFVGTAKVVITNNSSGDVSISKVVCPLSGLQIYLTKDDEPVYNWILVKVNSLSHVEVYTRLSPSKDVVNPKYIFKGIEAAYVMKYGI